MQFIAILIIVAMFITAVILLGPVFGMAAGAVGTTVFTLNNLGK